MDYDLAYELAMVRMEKEDKLIGLLLTSIGLYNMDINKVPAILPYMWESERFMNRFIEIISTKLKYLDDEKFINDWAESLGYFRTDYMGNTTVDTRYIIPMIKQRKDFLEEVIDLYGSDDVKVFFKLNK